MIFRDQPGSSGIEEALKNEHVEKIVDIFLDIREGEINFVKRVARFLQAYSGFPSGDFSKDLEVLRNYKIRRIDLNGQRFSSSFSSNELLSSIEALYSADDEDTINYRRGAIVELLTYKLINDRCQEGECRSNQRISSMYGPYASKQVDVVVFSEEKQQIEGYSCKIKAGSADCSGLRDLVDLSDEAKKSAYDICVGLVSLAGSQATC